MAIPSEYVVELLRQASDFTLYRGQERDNQSPVLVVASASEPPPAWNLSRLQHEYSLTTELDAAWAAQPIALAHHEGRAALILRDPGGEPLDQIIEQHKRQPIDLVRFLGIAIGFTAALRAVHRQGLIHKDIRPANALVDDSGRVWLTGFGIASQFCAHRCRSAPPWPLRPLFWSAWSMMCTAAIHQPSLLLPRFLSPRQSFYFSRIHRSPTHLRSRVQRGKSSGAFPGEWRIRCGHRATYTAR